MAISPDGQVLGVEIMSYRETHGGQVRDAAWRKHFAGKTLADPFKLDEDVPNISGATLSCRNVMDGVKRLLAMHKLYLAPCLNCAACVRCSAPIVEVGARGPMPPEGPRRLRRRSRPPSAAGASRTATASCRGSTGSAGERVALSRPTLRLLRLARRADAPQRRRFDCTVGGTLVRRGALPDHGGPAPLPRGSADGHRDRPRVGAAAPAGAR